MRVRIPIFYFADSLYSSYYLLCVGSIATAGTFRMGIKAALQPLNTRTGTSSSGVTEIQRVSIGGNLMSERQVMHCRMSNVNL